MNHLHSESVDVPEILPLRPCLRPPIPEIAIAAGLMNHAVTAHLDGRFGEVARLLEQANMPKIMEWAYSLAGPYSDFNTPRFRLGPQSKIPVAQREKKRMPSSEDKQKLHEIYGYHCCFCGTPVIRTQVRNRLLSLYSNAIPWEGKKEIAKHAAIYTMIAQYDHVVPYSRGGDNSLENILLTCLPCNYGRGGFTLEEMGLFDPRTRKRVECTVPDWDGLERLLQ